MCVWNGNYFNLDCKELIMTGHEMTVEFFAGVSMQLLICCWCFFSKCLVCLWFMPVCRCFVSSSLEGVKQEGSCRWRLVNLSSEIDSILTRPCCFLCVCLHVCVIGCKCVLVNIRSTRWSRSMKMQWLSLPLFCVDVPLQRININAASLRQ